MPGSNERMVRRLSSWLLATATSKFRRERYSPSDRVMAWSSSAIRILVFDCKRILSNAQVRRQKNEVLSRPPRACLAKGYLHRSKRRPGACTQILKVGTWMPMLAQKGEKALERR